MMLKIAYVALKISFHAIVFRSASHVTQLHDFFFILQFMSIHIFVVYIKARWHIDISHIAVVFCDSYNTLSDHVMSVFVLMLSKLKSNYDSCTFERNYFQHISSVPAPFLFSLFLAIIINIHERRLLLSFLQCYSGNKRRIASSSR